jgi:hypothetical protein
MALGIGGSGNRIPSSPGGSTPGASGTVGPKPPFSVEQGQKIDPRISTGGGPGGVTETAPVKAPAPPTSPAELVETSRPTSRSLYPKDLNTIIINSGKNPTPLLREVVANLIKYGQEASHEKLDTVSNLVQNSSHTNAIESAVISVSKGLTQPKGVDVVSNFLNNQANITQSLARLQSSLSQFIYTLQSHPSPLLSALNGGVIQLAEHLERSLRKIAESDEKGKPASLLLNQGKVIKDFHLFTGLIVGLQDHAQTQDPQLAQVLKQPLQDLKSSIGKFIENLLTQSILSTGSSLYNIGKDEFAYWQIPNPMSKKESPIEILIKKDSQRRGQKQRFDSQKTKIVVKCETEDIGELAIVVEITGQKVVYMFYTQDEQTKKMILSETNDLKSRMAALNYDLVGIQTLPKKVDIKKLLLPTINLDRLSRIDAKI